MSHKKLTFEDPCFAESLTCDFADMTWTFEPYENFVVGSGKYAIIPIEEWQKIRHKLSQVTGDNDA